MIYDPTKYAKKRVDHGLNGWEKFLHRTQKLPTALTGLALGLCGIGACIDANIHTFDGGWRWWISCGCIAVATMLLLLATIRNTVHPKILQFEIKEPMISSFLPTFAMALMCISGFIAGWQHGQTGTPPCQVIGAIIMVFAVTVQLILCYFFTKEVLFKHKWNESEMYGTWFVPSVGIATAATLSSRFNQNILPNAFFQAIWWFAFIWYVALFFEVTYSLLFKKQSAKERFASVAVYFAPAGLTSTSFLITFAVPFARAIGSVNQNGTIQFLPGTTEISVYPEVFINVMLVILIAMSFTYSVLLIFVFSVRILKQEFSYLFASLTFPLSINSDAMAFTGTYLFTIGKDYHTTLPVLKDMAATFRIIGYIFVIISALIILYIAIRFIIKIGKDLSDGSQDHIFHRVYTDTVPETPVPQSK